MQEQLITFETAKLAKEKGFNEYCFYCYRMVDGEFMFEQRGFNNTLAEISKKIVSPTQSLLQKWLREEHNLYVEVFTANYAWNNKVKFYYHVREIHSKHDDKYHNYRTEIVGTYEEALEKGLYEALKLI